MDKKARLAFSSSFGHDMQYLEESDVALYNNLYANVIKLNRNLSKIYS